jgi:HNH endonuclease/Domain of unknown function (DUF222)
MDRPETGMRNTLISLDPVRDATMWAAIDRARREIRRTSGTTGSATVAWDQLQVDAVVHAIAHGSTSTGGLSVLIDFATLLGGIHDRMVCELADGTPLPVATVRRMAWEAEIIPVVLDGNGRALDVGTGQRLATTAQRTALQAMYATCGYPNCTVPFEACEIHHVVPWELGGPTDLANLLPLCLIEGHHHLVHEGGWTLTMTRDRVVTIRRPDGETWFSGTTVNRAPNGVASTRVA